MLDADFFEQEGSRSRGKALAIMAFWLPFVMILLVDHVNLAGGSDYRFPLPFEQQRPAHPPGRRLSKTTGDIVRSAGVPFVQDRFDDLTDIIVSANSQGFRDSENAVHADPEVVLCGASFADAGSTNANTLASLLSKSSGVMVQNRSLHGQGATASLTRYILQEGVQERAAKVVIWCVIEYALSTRTLKGLQRVKLSISNAENLRWLNLFDCNSQMKSFPARVSAYFQRQSTVGNFLSIFDTMIPPTCLDRGLNSPCSLYRFIDGGKPIAFLRSSLVFHTRHIGVSDVGAVAQNILKAKALVDKAGKQLLVVLVPNKFTILGDYVRPVLPDPHMKGLIAVTGRLRAVETCLSAASVEVVNLRPALAAAWRNGPAKTALYYPEDTHWTDAGIQVAHRAVGKRLRSMLTKSPKNK